MKTRFGSFAVLTCLVLPANAQPQKESPKSIKTDREQYGLIGPVETLRYEWALFSSEPNDQGEHLERDRRYVETVTFDTDGKLILRNPPPYSEHRPAM